ncbi:MAG: glycosyl transferase group 1, partial [Verrucomicrobiaceae bacterium]|nr:glycosyl transferase group 1 [Verrucomicrobiaceae bacterium]
REAFRAQHGLTGTFVVMYSGNHSPCHPLDTLLEAARDLAAAEPIHFMFIGGGSEFTKVKAFKVRHDLANITTLPYQPLDQLSASLSSADLHVVVMGTPFVGIVHPCKIYNILSLGLPFLGIGPAECHLTDLASRITDRRYTNMADHGDIAGLTNILQTVAERGPLPPSAELQKLGSEFSSSVLRPRLVDLIAECGTSGIVRTD